MMARVALGAYPEDWYYDPNRPSWLPYFIDTPDENMTKWFGNKSVAPGRVYPNPPLPPAPTTTIDAATGAVRLETPQETQARYREQVQKFFTGVSNATDQAKKDPKAIPFWLILAAVVAAVLLLRGRR